MASTFFRCTGVSGMKSKLLELTMQNTQVSTLANSTHTEQRSNFPPNTTRSPVQTINTGVQRQRQFKIPINKQVIRIAGASHLSPSIPQLSLSPKELSPIKMAIHLHRHLLRRTSGNNKVLAKIKFPVHLKTTSNRQIGYLSTQLNDHMQHKL